MKASNLFWGFFFITIGVLYLIARYSNIYIDWYSIWELWPVLIILAGISIMLKGTFFKPVISVLIGILLGFLTFGFFNDTFEIFEDRNYRHSHWEDYSENNYNISFDNDIKHVNLNIEAGAGKFYIEKTTDELVKGFSRGNVGSYNFTQTQNDDILDVHLGMTDTKIDLFGKNYTNQFKLSLNDNPTYDFDLEIGAAKAYFNLIPFKVKNIDLQTGAADTKIKLGDKSEKINLNVEMGAASLKIYIPKSSGCKIFGEMALVAKDFHGFKEDDDGNYITKNFDSASEKILMNIQGGLASFEVKRY